MFVIFLTVILIAVAIVGLSLKSSTGSRKADKKPLYWVAPMNPNYRRDEPGKSPMGMDLVPVYAEGNSDENTVKVSAAVVNNLGVRTAVVKAIPLSRVISTVGYVTADENKIEHIHTYTDGWIKILTVKTSGEVVKKGQLLLELFSPTLVNAQEELILALKYKNDDLISAGKKKLKTLGLNSAQVDQLIKTKNVIQNVKIYATKGGIVSHLNIREGKFVKPDTDIMTIEDLSHIWMIAEVFERQSNWVREGQIAFANLPYMPGKSWQGKVDYVYPQLDQKTHTLRVRLSFPNPDLTIKPEMYVNIKILSNTIQNAIAIPRSALIRTGEGDRVILALGDGKFKARPLTIGIESGDYYQVLSGVKPGEKVVTSAQFLIDSESNLKAEFSRMKESTNEAESGDHSSAPKEFFGMGSIQSINQDERLITLDHHPMPALNMPAMNMEFQVAPDVDLTKLNVSQPIDFMVVVKGDNQYIITKINPAKPMKMPSNNVENQ